MRSTSLLPSLLLHVVAAAVGMMRREAVVATIGDDGGPGENDLTAKEDPHSPFPPECIQPTMGLAAMLAVGLFMVQCFNVWRE